MIAQGLLKGDIKLWRLMQFCIFYKMHTAISVLVCSMGKMRQMKTRLCISEEALGWVLVIT